MKKIMPITGLVLGTTVGSVGAATEITKSELNKNTGILSVEGISDAKNGFVSINIPKYGKTVRRRTMKKIFGLCLGATLLSFVGAVNAAGTMEMELSCEEYGHIFSDKEQTFKLDINSNLAENFSGELEYAVLSDGTVIYSKEEAITIAPNGSLTKYPVIECPKYGIFDLKVTITDGTTDYETETIPFSYINACEEGELNPKMNMGPHMEVKGMPNDEVIKLMRDAGFGGFRCAVYWFDVEEHNKNEYEMSDHAEDILKAADMGLEPLILLSGGNGPWGCDNKAAGNLNMAPSTPEQIQAFANYCAYVANYFKGKVKHYEIWNEYMEEGSNGGDRTGTSYAKILAPAAEAIKKVDPDAVVVGMTTSWINNTFIQQAVTQLKAMGKNDCYDYVSVHPYNHNTRYGNSKVISESNTAKNISGKKLWYTERGWFTTSGTNGVTEHMQAVKAVDDYLVFVLGGHCEKYFWYDFQNDGTDRSYMEHNFGIIREIEAEIPGEAKPAYVALAAMNKIIGQATMTGSAQASTGRVYFLTDKNGEKLYAISGAVGNGVTISTGAGTFELLDMYSNVVETVNSTGVYRFTQSDDIMYLRKASEPAGCNVKLTDGKLYVNGHAMEKDQQVSFLVTTVADEIVYAGQATCGSDRAFSFTADAKGVNELYIKVNYGDVYNTEIETGFVLKLMCDGKRILSVKDITPNGNVKLVVSVNEEIKEKTDVYGAVYGGNALKYSNKITLNPGDSGDHDISINLSGISSFDKVSGFVWEGMNPVGNGVYFR